MRRRRKRTNRHLPAKGRLRDICDRLWSAAIREEWDNRCAVCGSGKVQAHHLVPRQFEATRYDMMNGIALCARHHTFDTHLSPHLNAAGWMAWLNMHHPERALWYMENRRPVWNGQKNADYFCGILRRLETCVSPEEYIRIVGPTLDAWLHGEDNDDTLELGLDPH